MSIHTRYPMKLVIGGILSLLLFSTASAQTVDQRCGIIPGFTEQPQPVDNCDTPFGVPRPNEDISLKVENIEILQGDTYPFFDTTQTIAVTGIGPDTLSASIEIFHERVLTNPTDQSQTFTLYDSQRFYNFNPQTDEAISFTFATTGRFHLVIREDSVAVSQSLLDRFKNLFISSAHAAVGDRTIISFLVTEPDLVLNGASNVLFLPGIQASRLYVDDDIVVPGLLNDVVAGERVWEPGNNNDVRALMMTGAGESTFGIHTQDILETISVDTGVITIGQSDVYAGFSNFMDGLTAGPEPVIQAWSPFAYDWRYDVFDVVENGTRVSADGDIANPIDEIRRLAADSFSGQVTLIGHSNGGLLAKAIMIKLEELGETDLVHRVIMIGTPQLGTPKAIGTILHGYDQEQAGGWVIDDMVAREVINNLPGAYALLPSAEYFARSTDSVVRFANTETLTELSDAYGETITDYATFQDFLVGSSDILARTLAEPIGTPATANEALLAQAIDTQARLQDWVAPEDVEVIEIIGVGIPTVETILYREITETNCIVGLFCDEEKFLKPFAEFNFDGDETVARLSADSYDSSKRTFYVDLEEVNIKNDQIDSVGISHFNMTEESQIQVLLNNIFIDSFDSIEFISEDIPEFTSEYQIEAIDSPVSILATDSNGNQTGVVLDGEVRTIKEEIPGSRYFEFGGTKYLIVPTDTDRTVTLKGEQAGRYTFTTARLDGSGQTILSQFQNATVTPEMEVTYTVEGGTYSNLKTDFDGDGDIDLVSTVAGEVVETAVVTFADLKQAIGDLGLSSRQERSVVRTVWLAERFALLANKNPRLNRLTDRLLLRVENRLERYERRQIIEISELESILKIIEQLRT